MDRDVGLPSITKAEQADKSSSKTAIKFTHVRLDRVQYLAVRMDPAGGLPSK
jgi:hypothetical protein